MRVLDNRTVEFVSGPSHTELIKRFKQMVKMDGGTVEELEDHYGCSVGEWSRKDLEYEIQQLKVMELMR